MDTEIEPAKSSKTDEEQSPAEDRSDDGPDAHHGARDLVRSALPILVGSVAVGIAAVAVVGVQINRHRKSKTLLHAAAVRAKDAKNALTHTAAGLSKRGRAAVRRVHR